MRAAFNADKKAFQMKVEELEVTIRERDSQIEMLNDRVHHEKGGSDQHKSELNFWNGKCAMLKRDLEYSERYAEKLRNECDKLSFEIKSLHQEINLKDHDCGLLKKQLNGLQEDNDRITRMY